MERFNRMPVNKAAREALIEMNETPCDAAPHCIQLLLSMLSRGAIEMEDDVAETVRAMMDWRPQRIINFLMVTLDEEYDPAGWKDARDFHELARAILNDVEEKMIRHFPWYRSTEL
ncbi:MAG TPA: hypothetical protein VHO84_02980 [Syntrophorhabdaceae bacterium]|nr:hypothetical protein [Syntrophorhabdaceae bacterium]